MERQWNHNYFLCSSTSSFTNKNWTTTDIDPDIDPASVWPRPWDPNAPIDFSGVAGVTDEQRARAEQLVVDTLRDLPAFADVSTVGALGYRSIGDAST